MYFSARKLLVASVAALALTPIALHQAVAPVGAANVEAEAATPARQAPSIAVVTAERREIVESLDVTGTVLPREEAAVGIDLSGMLVIELGADEGDRVTKGQVLARLDRTMLETQLAQAEANRAQAEASVAQVRSQIADAAVGVRQAEEALERATALQAKGVATRAQYDNAVNARDSAKAKLVSAEKALVASEAQLGVIDAQKRNVEIQIDKTEVRAPADGLVLARNATLGNAVSAGSGPLFRIAIDAKFELEANVPETALPRLRAGMPVAVALPGGVAQTGEIRMIAPEIDHKTRLGRIRVALDGAEARPGNFARGRVELSRNDVICVPSTALIYRGSEPFLQVVSDGEVATTPVVTGSRDTTHVAILDGVEEGAEIVARAGTFVADGDKVTPVRVETTGAVAP